MKFILFIFSAFVAIRTNAQVVKSLAVIRTRVLANSTTPIEYANALLYRSKDSVLVKGEISNKDGICLFKEIAPNHYYIRFSAVGFKTSYSTSFSIDSANIIIPDVVLTTTTHELNSVIVSATKAPFEYKRGTIVMNVQNLPTSAGGTALELLEKAPGVTVMDNNNSVAISLRGKQNVAIFIDGKQMQLSSAQLLTLLKSKSADEIEAIEIMPNPSAKYDAAGKGGVINIKTKKGKGFGANGFVTLSYIQGRYPKTNNTVGFNYRTSKINVFANYNIYAISNFSEFTSNIFYFNSIVKDKLDAETHILYYDKTSSDINTGKVGLDYTINKNNVIGININTSLIHSYGIASSSNFINDFLNNVQSIIYSDVNINNRDKSFAGNINYQSVLNKKGATLNIDLDYMRFIIKNNQALHFRAVDKNGNPIGTPNELSGNMPSYTNVYAGKIDITHPINNSSKISAGTKFSFIEGDNSVIFLRKQNNNWITDFRTNHYVYKEYITAGYINWEKNFKKYTMQVGLRAEATQTQGHQLTVDTTINRNYINFFPNVSLGYHINEKHDISFSYAKRITRPDYEDLNPFVIKLDSLSEYAGNTNLIPETSNSFEIGYSYNSKIMTTLNYTVMNNAINSITLRNPVYKSFSQVKRNFYQLSSVGINVTLATPILKWWNTNTSVDLINTYYNEKSQSDGFKSSLTSLLIKFTNTFNITKTINAEMSGLFNINEFYGVFIFLPRHVLNLGVSKSIFNNKGSLKLSLKNIFNALNRVTYDPYAGTDKDRFRLLTDTRTISLSISYRIGKNVKTRAAHTGSATEEKSRTGH